MDGTGVHGMKLIKNPKQVFCYCCFSFLKCVGFQKIILKYMGQLGMLEVLSTKGL